jgi:hypothetical protein
MTAIKQIILLTLLVSGPPLAADAVATIVFRSGVQRVALVVLFTSEGCSSCPPADKWLSKLRADPGLWKNFNPIAFHVDYWDYIGWEDKFALPEFGVRQRRYVREGGVGFVYTPGLFRDGQEWQGWRTSEPLAIDAYPIGSLNLTVQHGDVAARFDTLDDDLGDLNLNVAILGMNLQTTVRAGENAGKTLRHDFVVVGLTSVALEYSDGKYVAATELPNPIVQSGDRAIVAWVSSQRYQAPIQSAGGFLSEL